MLGKESLMERLIRDSERLAIIKDYVKSEEKYINKSDLMVLLGIEEEFDAD